VKKLVVKVDLKNIKAATERQQREALCDMRRVYLEVIGSETINERLNRHAVFGLLPPNVEPASYVYGCTLLRLWAEQCFDCRYWLCTRFADDPRMHIKGCLNNAELIQSFGDIFDEKSACPVVTLFREDKKAGEPSQEITDDTIVVFCKMYEAEYSDLSYAGYLLVQKTMKCYDMLQAIADNLLYLSNKKECDAYLEVGDGNIKDITSEQNSLEECGLYSGACIIVRTRLSNQTVPVDVVQEALQQMNSTEGKSESSEHLTDDASDASRLSETRLDVAEASEVEDLQPECDCGTPTNEETQPSFVIIQVQPLPEKPQYAAGISLNPLTLDATVSSSLIASFLSSQRRHFEHARSHLHVFLSVMRSHWRQFRRLSPRRILAMLFVHRANRHDGPARGRSDVTAFQLAEV